MREKVIPILGKNKETVASGIFTRILLNLLNPLKGD